MEYNTELIAKITGAYSKHFPHSSIRVATSSMGGSTLFVRCFLASHKSEVSGEIWGNDLFSILFNIEFQAGSVLVLESVRKEYTTKPTNPLCVYGHNSVAFRRVSGNEDRIVQAFDKFCAKLRSELQADLMAGNIPAYFVEIVTRKLS